MQCAVRGPKDSTSNPIDFTTYNATLCLHTRGDTIPSQMVNPVCSCPSSAAHQMRGVSLLCADGRHSACHAAVDSLSAENWPTEPLRLNESPVENLTDTVKSVGCLLFCEGEGRGRGRGGYTEHHGDMDTHCQHVHTKQHATV